MPFCMYYIVHTVCILMYCMLALLYGISLVCIRMVCLGMYAFGLPAAGLGVLGLVSGGGKLCKFLGILILYIICMYPCIVYPYT